MKKETQVSIEKVYESKPFKGFGGDFYKKFIVVIRIGRDFERTETYYSLFAKGSGKKDEA